MNCFSLSKFKWLLYYYFFDRILGFAYSTLLTVMILRVKPYLVIQTKQNVPEEELISSEQIQIMTKLGFTTYRRRVESISQVINITFPTRVYLPRQYILNLYRMIFNFQTVWTRQPWKNAFNTISNIITRQIISSCCLEAYSSTNKWKL